MIQEQLMALSWNFQHILKGMRKKNQRSCANTAANATNSTTNIATTQAKGIKVKLSRNIQANVE